MDQLFEFDFRLVDFDTMDRKDTSGSLRNSSNSTELNNGNSSKPRHNSAYHHRHSLALPEKRKRLIRQKRVYESEDNTGLNQTRGIVVFQEEDLSVLNGNILDNQLYSNILNLSYRLQISMGINLTQYSIYN